MGLKLKLKPYERVFLNGALVRNGASGAELELLNEIPLLREKDILLEAEAQTPCQKLYLIVQTMYFEPANQQLLQPSLDALVQGVASAAPSARELLSSVLEHIQQQQYYAALKALQELIQYEAELMNYAKESE